MVGRFHRTRFAPSPTGWLHRGHVLNALWTWGIAKQCGAEVLLRIEDHDQSRCRPQYVQGIQEDLAWLGLESSATHLQSHRQSLYHSAIRELQQKGLVYPCLCTRARIAAANQGLSSGSEPRYPGTCRERSMDHANGNALRVRLPSTEVSWMDTRSGWHHETPQTKVGDTLLRDRHNLFTYQFCVVVDDLEQGIDLVVRGEDLQESTARQILLGQLLGRAQPPTYVHHSLLLDTQGKKLSKRDHAASIRAERESGISVSQLLGEVCVQAGLLPQWQPLTLPQALELIPMLNEPVLPPHPVAQKRLD